MRKLNENNKNKELLKITAASFLSILLFSAMFIAVNQLAFASKSNHSEDISSITPAPEIRNPVAANSRDSAADASASDTSTSATDASAPGTGDSSPDMSVSVSDASGSASKDAARERSAAENYQKPVLNVYEDLNEPYTYLKTGNPLSPEEAAEIGALYIWEVFGTSIDGKTVEMFYSAHPSLTRALWIGTVADSKDKLNTDDLEHYESLHTFSIDAATGERIDIRTSIETGNSSLSGMKQRREYLKNDAKVTTLEEMNAIYHSLPDQKTEEWLQFAREAAGMHFNQTQVSSIEYTNLGGSIFPKGADGFQFSEGKPEDFITYTAIDETGRKAHISISTVLMQVLSISTSDANDYTPGYSYDVPGSVG